MSSLFSFYSSSSPNPAGYSACDGDSIGLTLSSFYSVAQHVEAIVPKPGSIMFNKHTAMAKYKLVTGSNPSLKHQASYISFL